MRLAFDLDGTVADMHSALAREARRLFPGIDPEAVPDSTPASGAPAEGSDNPQEGESTLSIGQLTSRQQREILVGTPHQSEWLQIVLPSQNTEVTTIAPDPFSDRFYVGTVGEGVFVYDGKTERYVKREPAPPVASAAAAGAAQN